MRSRGTSLHSKGVAIPVDEVVLQSELDGLSTTDVTAEAVAAGLQGPDDDEALEMDVIHATPSVVATPSLGRTGTSAHLRGRIGERPQGGWRDNCGRACSGALVGLVLGVAVGVCFAMTHTSIAPYMRMRHTSKTHFLTYLGLAGIFAISGACFRVPSACCRQAARRVPPLPPRAKQARLPAAGALVFVAVMLLAIPSRAQYTVRKEALH